MKQRDAYYFNQNMGRLADAKKAKNIEKRKQLIRDHIYALRTNQPLPEITIPPAPKEDVNMLNIWSKAKQHDDRVRYAPYADVARVRADLQSGRIGREDAIQYLESVLTSI